MKSNTKLQKSWIWDKTVEDFVREQVQGYSLNVCSGKSPLGDVKVDLDPKDKSIIQADMKNLPFEDNTFDTVIEDPPWKIDYYHRWKPFFECVRVCKVGGKIIYNAYWIPESDYTDLVNIYVRQDYRFSNASIISIFKKKMGNLQLNYNQ